jgi:hypothetical protein
MSFKVGECRYALRFVSGVYKGTEYLLPKEQQAVVGRAPEADLFLDDDKVSRKHAQFSAVGDRLSVKDLGSTNGTFVNGARISECALERGDRILIGTSIMRVIEAGESSPSLLSATIAEMRSRMEQAARGAPTAQVTTIAGTLEEVPLPDVVQLIHNLRKTGVVHVSSDRQRGRIYLREGTVYFAEMDGIKGNPLKVACRMFHWSSGRFDFVNAPAEQFEGELQWGSEGLIMEAMRQQDELERLQAELPSSESRLEVVTPLTNPLRALAPEALDVLQAVLGGGRVADVLDKCAGTDLEVCRQIQALVRDGYLRPLS